nr:uncharacterized protein CI109_000225 [Kwoniella shandongensis]KAA5531384.1 hypothetical protein CI109_000225 [Kwoniella shandongensis]
MYSVKATLLALASSLVLTAGRPHLVSNSTKHQARASIPNVWAGDGVPQRHDIMLKSGPGDWIAAAICALGALSDDVIKTNVVNVRADGSAENGCVSVKLIDEDGKQQEQSACYFDTNSLQFNYGDYW